VNGAAAVNGKSPAGGDTAGGEHDYTAGGEKDFEDFVPTLAWVEGWKARLPLHAIFVFLERVGRKSNGNYEY